jgi:hypothetical protein
VITGVVLTWAWPRTSAPGKFIAKRVAALFPLYWWIAVPLIALALSTNRMLTAELWKVPFWLSGLGIVSPQTFFPIVDAWWYMTLALQLVVVFPLLRTAQGLLGTSAFVLGATLVSIVSFFGLRSLGLDYAVQGFIGCRLFEVATGMAIGTYRGPGERGWPPRETLLSIAVSATVFSVALPAAAIEVVLAPVVVLLAVWLVVNVRGRFGRWASVAGGLTFAFYLSHSPWAKPILGRVAGAVPTVSGIALAGMVSLAVAILIALGFQMSFIWFLGRFEARN